MALSRITHSRMPEFGEFSVPVTRRYFDYICLVKCRYELEICNLPEERALSWIFYHDSLELAVTQSRRNHPDGIGGYEKLDATRCIRATKTLFDQTEFWNFMLLFHAAQQMAPGRQNVLNNVFFNFFLTRSLFRNESSLLLTPHSSLLLLLTR